MVFDPSTLNLSALEQQHGLPSGLLQSVMGAESAGNPNAVSPKGAQGLFQFLPQTAKAYGINPLDPQQAAVGAARMYGDLSKQFGGDVPSMLAAYNWGSGNLEKKGMQNAPQETRDYIDKVQSGMQYAQADTGNVTDGAAGAPITMDVQLPDGTVVQGVPNGITQTQLMDMLNKNGVSPTQDKNYFQRVGADVAEAANKGSSIITEGTRNPLSAAIQVGGQAANMVAAPIAEAIPQSIQEGIGSVVGGMKDAAGNALHKTADYLDTTAAGRAFGDLGVAHPALKDNLQELSDTAKAAANIGLTLAPTSPVKNATKSVGKSIYKSGQKIEDAASAKLAEDLYTPKLTPKVLEERAANTVATGVNQAPVYVAPAHEAAAIKVLQELPIKKSNTLQKNFNIVSNAVTDAANSLSTILKKTPIKYKPDFFTGKLDSALNQLKNDPLIIGDGEKVAERIFNKMKEIAAKNAQTPHGLLKARQEFDAWARSKKGSVFDANDTAFSTAVRNARNAANSFISDIAPHADVKASLLKQSQLLDAMDNMATKIPSAPRTRIGMAAQKAGKLIPDSGYGKTAGLAALGTLGWSAPIATAAMATGAGIGYGGYKLATSPMLRKGLGRAVEYSAPAIALSPLAAFGDKFDRKITNKPKGE